MVSVTNVDVFRGTTIGIQMTEATNSCQVAGGIRAKAGQHRHCLKWSYHDGYIFIPT